MSTTDIINLAGLLLNLVGTFILAFSLSRYLTSLHGTLVIHNKQIEGIINRHERVLVADVANLLKTGVENNRARTVIGLFFVIIGFLLQIVPYFLVLISATKF